VSSRRHHLSDAVKRILDGCCHSVVEGFGVLRPVDVDGDVDVNGDGDGDGDGDE
jgi:hypothetical protein